MDIDEVINDALFPSATDEMVIIKNIELYSMCEHHMLPFIGKCHVAYIPNGKIIGLSKIARLVDVFARRLQIQENLTNEIANCIIDKTQATGVAVMPAVLRARGTRATRSSAPHSIPVGRWG